MQTDPFTIPRGKIAFNLFLSNGKWLWILCGIAIVAGIVLCSVTGDYRWGIVSLMVVMIVTPMFGALFYIDRGFRPVTVLNCCRHSVSVEDGSIIVKTLLPSDDNEESKENNCRFVETGIEIKEITSYKIGINDVQFSVGAKGVLFIPVSAFPTPTDFTNFVNHIIAVRFPSAIITTKDN